MGSAGKPVGTEGQPFVTLGQMSGRLRHTGSFKSSKSSRWRLALRRGDVAPPLFRCFARWELRRRTSEVLASRR